MSDCVLINKCTVLLQLKMARGHQKLQSQQKNAEKQAKMKKSQGSDQKKAAQAALVYVCTVCKACVFVFTGSCFIFVESHIITSAKEVMLLPGFVYLYVCLSAGFLKIIWMNFHKILGRVALGQRTIC